MDEAGRFWLNEAIACAGGHASCVPAADYTAVLGAVTTALNIMGLADAAAVPREAFSAERLALDILTKEKLFPVATTDAPAAIGAGTPPKQWKGMRVPSLSIAAADGARFVKLDPSAPLLYAVQISLAPIANIGRPIDARLFGCLDLALASCCEQLDIDIVTAATSRSPAKPRLVMWLRSLANAGAYTTCSVLQAANRVIAVPTIAASTVITASARAEAPKRKGALMGLLGYIGDFALARDIDDDDDDDEKKTGSGTAVPDPALAPAPSKKRKTMSSSGDGSA